MPQLLILTGPQGSGNHLFSKIFAQHPDVNSWTALNDAVWIGHDHEPFAALWKDPELIKTHNWDTHKYHVTSISCPYRDNGVDAWPKYKEFIQVLQSSNIDVKIAIIGRDQNILAYQEQRLRSRVTYPDFLERLPYLMEYNPVFLSQELAYLYKESYIKQISQQLDFPVKYNPNIFVEDANKKYLVPVTTNWLDPYIKQASKQ
jgi:hypothetical protein